MRSVHVGRQPIYDRDLEVHGYELLFRASSDGFDEAERPGARLQSVGAPRLRSATAVADRACATTQIIVSTLSEFALERLVGDRLAFVNVTRPMVVGDVPIPFGPEGAVLELTPDVVAGDDVIAGCEALAAAGYQLALDDFDWEPERLALLPLAQFVKVAVPGRPREDLAAAVARCRDAGVLAVAQRVGDVATMELCSELGFDLFQGYFSLRPDVFTARTITPSHLTCLELIARLSDPKCSVTDIESIVRTDLALNYRVLRAANSATSGLTRRVESIRDALVLLGVEQLRSWLLLMVLADSGNTDEEQLTTAITRARTCELVAQQVPGMRGGSAYVVGVLSSLDVVLGIPMGEVLDRLPLADDLRAALLDGTGALGELLTTVLAYERGDDEAVAASAFDAFDLSRAYLSAVGWSLQLCESALSA
jgi:EAL and modified HD-GYP domain-containing signal transduction protein